MKFIEIHTINYVIFDGFQDYSLSQLRSVFRDYLAPNGVFDATLVILRAFDDLILKVVSGEVTYAE